MEEDCKTAEKRLQAEISKLNHERKKNVLTLKVRETCSFFLTQLNGFSVLCRVV